MKIYTQAELAKIFKVSESYIAHLRKIKVIKPFIKAKTRGCKNLYTEEDLLSVEKYLREAQQRKGFRGGNYTESKCWTCLKSYNGCSWSRSFIPVPGWNARKVDISLTMNVIAYSVKDCPEYEKEEWVKTRDGMMVRKKPIPDEWKDESVKTEEFKNAIKRKPHNE